MGKSLDFGTKRFFMFDMDGTLADSMWLWDDFLEIFLESYQKKIDMEARKMFEELPLRKSAEYVAKRFGLPLSGEDIFREWTTEIQYKYWKELCLKQGAGQYLHYLKENGKKIALVTANHRELAEGFLDHHDVLRLFDVLVCGDQMEIDKSDPEYYRYALQCVGGAAENAVLFEDTYAALRTAKKIPVDTVIVEDLSARQDRNALMEKADLYIRHFEHKSLYSFTREPNDLPINYRYF